jgi:hypothetical protein
VARFRALITAKDDLPQNHRDHQRHRMLAWNKEADPNKVRCCFQYILFNTTQRDSALHRMIRVGSATTWSSARSWTATSGDSEHWNNRQHEWLSFQGPLPLTADISSKPHLIGAEGYPSQEYLEAMSTWEDTDDDPETPDVRVAYEYEVLDGSGDGRLKKDGEEQTYRDEIFIHPDGNDIGTQGCIGIREGYAHDFRETIDWLRDDCKIHGNYPSKRIPLFVKHGFQTSQSELNDYVSYERPGS